MKLIVAKVLIAMNAGRFEPAEQNYPMNDSISAACCRSEWPQGAALFSRRDEA